MTKGKQPRVSVLAPAPAPPPAHGKGGKYAIKRHRPAPRDNLKGITKPSIRRIARRGGIKRLSNTIYDEARGALRDLLVDVERDMVIYTEHDRVGVPGGQTSRKTVRPGDVVRALKNKGHAIYL